MLPLSWHFPYISIKIIFLLLLQSYLEILYISYFIYVQINCQFEENIHWRFASLVFLFLQALAELCEIKFGKTHPVCTLVSIKLDRQSYIMVFMIISSCLNLFKQYVYQMYYWMFFSHVFSWEVWFLHACLVIVFVYTFLIPAWPHDLSTGECALLYCWH